MIVRLYNGLGNQMFQYAFGRSVSRARDEKLLFKKFRLGRRHQRAYSLDPFNVDVKFTRWAFGPKFNQKTHCHDPDVYTAPAGSYFIGYWQTEKYFDEPLVRKELTLRNPVSPESQQVARLIAGGPSAFIHVRRTDYLRPFVATYFPNLSMDYYNEAIALVRSRVPTVHFFVFSDDPAWCRKAFPGEGFMIVGHNGWGSGKRGPGREHEDLWLMSRCDHAIIANSSFSWWGAWLNSEKNRIVIAPKRWFTPAAKLPTHDIVPERWITL